MKTATYRKTVSRRTAPFGLASVSLLLGITTIMMLVDTASLSAGETRPIRVSMTVDAADEPRPALRYSLFHDVYDQVPGNAALAYGRATRLMVQNRDWNEHMTRCVEWLELPLDQLPVESVVGILSSYRGALNELRKASRHEYCNWEIPIRTDGFGVLLPHLAELRSGARLLALDIRLAIREGRFEDAIEGLRTGLTLARHTGDSTLLIEGLVGVAIAQLMLGTIDDFVRQPGAPNLYWALTDLPPAWLNPWRATLWERSAIYTEIPILRDVGKRPINAIDLQRAVSKLRALGGDMPFDQLVADDPAILQTAGLVWAVYPLAREGLLREGMARTEVDEFSAAEVVVRHVGGGYLRHRDEFFKWLGLPYPVARERLARAEAEFEKAIVKQPIENIFVRIFLPALTRAADRFAELDRQFAMLRCVEAIRLHAAQHDLELPASLDQIEGVPVPTDPMTGLPFMYRLEGRTAVLDAAPLPDGVVRRPKTYEITIRR
jgi:hypothetical protein